MNALAAVARRVLTALCLVAAAAPGSAAEGPPRVAIETPLGRIVVELDPEHAPTTVANFLRYVDEERYTRGGRFYRVVREDNQPDNAVKIAVVQGGVGFDPPSPLELPAIAHETTAATGLRHRDGTISMARNEPGSASSEIFICVGDQPELDFGGRRNPDGQGFAAFGRVIAGMEVVRAIHARPAAGQLLVEAVAFTARRAAPEEGPGR